MSAVNKVCFYKVGQFQLCKDSLALLTPVSTFLPLTIQMRILSSVERCLLFVVSPITNADMVIFTQRDAMQCNT